MTMVGRARGPLASMVGCLVVAACSTPGDSAAHREQVAALKEGAAAQVGDQIVSVAQVRELSKAAGIAPEEARSRLVYDALMAAGARAEGYDRRDDVVGQRRAVLARALIDQMKRETNALPITDEEVAKHTQMHWLDMDRPVARRTVHAVVMPKQSEQPAEWAKADEVASRIAEAVRGEKDAAQFKKKAEAVDAAGMKVVVQDLPPVTEDGRVADLTQRPPPGQPPSTFDPAFVKAVFALEAVGDQSRPSRSSFGTHVILLVGIQEASRLDLEKRRETLAEEIRATRMRERLEGLLSSLRAGTPPVVERNAEAMLLLVSDEPSGAAGRGP